MRAYLMTAAGVAALATAACGQSGTNSSVDQSQPAAAETSDQPQESPVDEGAMTTAERQAAFKKRAEDNLAASTKFLKDNAKNKDVHVTDSGLQYKVLEKGPEGGATPVSTDIVVVQYVGTTKDGIEFDSSRAHGAAATFPLNQVIPGWTEGVQLMSEGDKYRFYLPPDLAYGEMGTPGGPIGPNEALVFDVELIKVQNPERNLEAAKKFLEENAKKEGVQTTASGLQYQVLSEGPDDGKHPVETDTVKVDYRGTLANGTEFDSSYKRGTPAEFPLNHVIPGWTEGLQLMSEGDKFRFFIPPELAYGERGTPGGPIGPNEALVFDVELIAVE